MQFYRSLFRQLVRKVIHRGGSLRFEISSLKRFSPTLLSSSTEIVFGLLTSIVVIRLTRPEIYGELVIITTIVSVGMSLFGTRFGRIIAWIGSKHIVQQRESELLALLIVVLIIDASLMALTALVLALSGGWLMQVFLGKTASTVAFQAYLWVLCFKVGRFVVTLPALYEYVGIDAFVRFIQAFCRLCIIALAAYLSSGNLVILVYGYVAAEAVNWLISLTTGLMVIKRRLGWQKPQFEQFNYRQFAHYSLHLFFQDILKAFGNKAGHLIVAYFLNAGQVALYDVALGTATVGSGLFTPFRNLLQRRLTDFSEKRKIHKLTQLLRKISFRVFLLTCSALVVFTIWGKQAVALVYGEEYVASYGLILIVGFGYMVFLCTFWNSSLSVALSAPGRVTSANLLRVLVSIPSTAYLTYLYGTTGAAIALSMTLVSVEIFLTVANLRAMFRLERSLYDKYQ